jgi:NAD(P) transhydrogenase subunit beta
MADFIPLLYLLSAVMFIVGLKRLSSPATARSGNTIASVGMLIAIVVTLGFGGIVDFRWIIVGMLIGSTIGAVFARRVKMTGMPQMVALLNGFGGGASALVAGSEFLRSQTVPGALPINVGISVQLSVLIGALTFSGSLIAFGKLQEVVTGKAVTYPLQKLLNAVLLIGAVVMVVMVVADPQRTTLFYGIMAVALVLGVLSVLPIGGADMPVVISLLNSYSGIAAAMTGFVINNYGLIISGALVGASGLILTQIMCKAMNRSLVNVLFGAFGATSSGAAALPGSTGDKTVRQVTAEDAATMLAYARSVIVHRRSTTYGKWQISSRRAAGK